MEERDFGGGPVNHAVAGEAEHCGAGVAWLDGEVEWNAQRVDGLRRGARMREPVGKAGSVDEEADGERERVGAQPFEARFCSREARFRGEAGAFEDVQAVSGDEKRPEMCGFGDVHGDLLKLVEVRNAQLQLASG